MPTRMGERLGRRLGLLAYGLGWRREVVEAQLAAAFPDHSDDWTAATARASFEHVGREMVTAMALQRRGLDEVARRLEDLEGRESLAEAFAEGRGVVMVSGHLGNWEFAGSTLAALGYPTDAVMQTLKNRRLNRYIVDSRRRLGMELIDRYRSWDALVASVRSGRILAFVADQDAGASGMFVPFFGRPASTHRAPALVALRAGAAFFMGGVRRVAPQRYRGWVVRLDPPAGLNVKDQAVALTRMWTAELERRIRVSPEQYFWHHKRWKTRPPGTARA
jgi:KDO2-lipid IV(A) lauroyltransferase